eukprot:CAMPEP_0204911982 /NCGR_PEP_ID=MMETSP1397-20131031/10206_1 /ASSEMBLY_ACC=CAM_ASM_000891 /TAXON_ID=49980 /ORGANISM="Climacostomum Climacostomum virens, Strain Stock W-24" /LENGTH=400 /DNA_ID=CAMNT_0052082733 /DNA_START=144 /DNA_END=1343 /DNA_ORIENTATION=-
MHRSNSSSVLVAGLKKNDPTDPATPEEEKGEKLPRIKTPAKLNPTKIIGAISELAEMKPVRSASRLLIEAKYSAKPKPKQLSSTTSANSLLPSSHMRRLSEGTRGETINVVTRCGYKTRTGSQMGSPKRNNQDAFMIAPQLGEVKGQYAFGVFDGHGSYGHFVSGHINDKLPQILAAQLKIASNDKTIELCLERSFEQMQAELVSSSIDCTLSGSTACVVLIRGSAIFTANVGDSRAVIGKKHKDTWKNRPLSRDHKPDWPDETKRITQAGGRVRPYYDNMGNPVGPHRVWLAHKDIPGLAMSRSFGDLIGSQVGISSIPEIRRYSLTSEDKFIIIGSDGLWEFMSNQEAVDIVGADYLSASAESSCDKLVREAVRRWNRQEDVVDDITVVIVYLNVPSR